MGKLSRTKGHNFERQVANRLKSIWKNCRRLLENHKDDANGVDILGTDPYFFQCKKLKRYASINLINEVQCERAFGDIPVLVTAGDRQEPIACLPLEAFIELLEIRQREKQKLDAS